MQKNEHIVRKSASEIRKEIEEGRDRTDWDRLDSMSDYEIEHNAVDDMLEHGFPDESGPIWVGGLPEPFGNGRKLRRVLIDADIVEWFMDHGEDYQERMNAVLRDYVERQLKRDAS